MRDEMEGQRKQVPILGAAEITAALVDLGRLSQQIGFAAPNTSASIAQALLERIVALCDAQQGALLLVIDNPSGEQLSFMPSVFNKRATRIFALSAMGEGEALARMDSYATNGADLQTLPHEPCWVSYKLPVSSLAPSQVASSAERRANSRVSVMLPSSQLALPLYALLLLGWAGKEESSRLSRAERGRNILPLVADVAGTVLANLLLSEQVHELEASINRQALREMELLKAELLATVSHELRSPLASIKGYAATLLRHERRISREERHEFLVAIAAASDRLERIIDRLLEISQLETGTMSIERSPVDIVRLAHEAIIAAEQQTSTQLPRHFTFHLRPKDAAGVPTQREPLIMADPRRLREVLDNLLENAINYSPEGGVIDVVVQPVQALLLAGKFSKRERKAEALPESDDAYIELTYVQPAGHKLRQLVEICVCDYGLGIPAEHLDRIFDRFHRVD